MSTDVVPPEARDLSPEERQERVDICHAINQRIITAITEGRKAMWELCKSLYEFDEQQGWLALGYENQREWLAQPEIGMSRAEYFRAVRRWRELAVHRSLSLDEVRELEPSKVDVVLPAVQDGKVRWNTARDDVESLGVRDLREKYVRPSHSRSGDQQGGDVTGGAEEAADSAEDSEDDVVDGQTTVEENMDGNEEENREVLGHAAHVESYLELGGDVKRAQRHWEAFVQVHPVFQAIGMVGSCVHESEGAPDRREAAHAWRFLKGALGLPEQIREL